MPTRRRTGAAAALTALILAGLCLSAVPGGSATAPGSLVGPSTPTFPALSHPLAARAGCAVAFACVAAPLAPPSATNTSAPDWQANTAAGAPPPRADAAVAFDPTMSAVIVFGGFYTGSPCLVLSECGLGDTWEWHNGHWTDLTPASRTSTNSPSGRWGAAMTYDPALGGLLLFGGTNATSNGLNNPALGDTWEFVDGSWSPLCTNCTAGVNAPSARWDAGLAYDAADGIPVLFGGETTVSGTATALNDTWSFGPTNWTQVPTSRSPSGRYAFGMQYSPATRSVELFGGFPVNAQTWSFASGSWTPLTEAVAPSGRGAVATAVDPLDGRMVLFGGCASSPCSGGEDSDTWTLGASGWSNVTAELTNSPPARSAGALSPTIPNGTLMLFGGEAARTVLNDSWFFSYIVTGPVRASVSTLDVTMTTVLSVSAAGGFGALSYTWTGLPPGCSSADVASLRCTASGSGPYQPTIGVTVQDASAHSVGARPVQVTFNTLPAVQAQALPQSGVVPLQVSFLANVTGGTPPLSETWEFGDGSTGLGLSPSHTYARSGTFNASVWVNDSTDHGAHAVLAVRVIATLAVEASFAPAEVRLGNSTVLTVNVSGGVAPYRVTFADVPPGCSAGSTMSFVCAPTQAGAFQLGVRVSDASGQSRNLSANLTVVPPASTGGNGGPTPRSSPSVNFVVWGTVAALVAALIAFTLLFELRRRRRNPPVVPPVRPAPPPANLYVPPPPERR